MAIGLTFIIVAVLVVAVWLIIEIKRMKHKVFAILLIGLILFTYISFSVVIKDQEIDFTSFSGLTHAGKIYFVWLGTLFGNMKSITAYAFNQDWKSVDEEKINNSFGEEVIWERL